MKKTLFLLHLFCFIVCQETFTQVKWSIDSIPAADVTWNNYSTTYLGNLTDSRPILMTAIPDNGILSGAMDINTPLDLTFTGSLYGFRSTPLDHASKLYTCDSSEVYFLTPGIHRKNAAGYEYRVTLDAKTVITPWTDITRFSDIPGNTFKNGFGYLGGYKTTWGNYIIVELRKKGSDTSFTSAVVYWKETKPTVRSIYTSQNLNDFFNLLKNPWNSTIKSGISPQHAVFPSTENTIIYFLSADINKKEEVEYQLMQNEKTMNEWKPNDYDNNFIWLKDLKPGKYQLQIRYSRQRHNVSVYDFEIKPAWHQTTAFKISAGGLIAAFFGFIVLLFRLRTIRRKVERERLTKDKLKLELKSVYAQLNPHFIFNALSSIQALVNKNDPDKANQYLSEFGSLLRHSLTSANKDFTPLDQEIATLERYLKLEQLRFGFLFQIHIDEAINVAETVFPSLLLQPLLENAVKHGVAGMHQQGNIELHIIKQNNDMQVVVCDNGRGFMTNERVNGHGLQLTHERIRLLNEMPGNSNIKLFISQNTPSGTQIVLEFKNWLQ
jgi:two-component system, LytTR family, sensor kinase